MGNVLKAVGTGGLSLLPGKLGKVAGSVATGLPLFGGDERRPVPPVGAIERPGMQEGPAQDNIGLISKLVQAPGAGGFLKGPMEAGVPAAPQETPRQRAARQAAQRASRGNPTQALAVGPQQRQLPLGKVNPTEVPTRKFVTNQGY